ncbi:DUF3426 domain-containing protein [Stutzerimonas azotifigens]|uniref:DUF3426 domain-containing protein n=1 Tax=Stutzerimonas azotifigens TaxID=291995 RepID=A0ABR5YVN5_9GAMM|nr:DUF3426 domain-containing protein [Stutzerimonas azotifigens]MBA1272000.1 DUF3426 domain-containing protein [Stutzerimonas azotifigens]
MSSFVTQCPHCRTSFRVSRAQLGAAQGVVRCGACLEVFNAARQLLVNQNVRATPAPPAPPTPLKPQADRETLWIHDDLDLDHLDLDEELARLEQEELQLSREFMELEQRATKTAFNRPNQDEQDPLDEAWAEQLLREESDHRAPDALPEPQQEVTFSPVTPDEPVPPAPLTTSTLPLQAAAADERNGDTSVPLETLTTEEQGPKRRKSRRASDNLKNDVDPALERERLFDLDDEPLELDWQKPKSPWGSRLGWGALTLLALLALGAQYAAYNFAELARQDRYRPWFEWICPTLGCEVPAKVDITQVRSSNLVVRSHPEFSGALVVDAILYNRAPFSQPFPMLELRFADINGQLIASRRFKPGEYLAGELAGQADMPPQTPIHISLDILDPGPRAVNYSLSFHSPE